MNRELTNISLVMLDSSAQVTQVLGNRLRLVRKHACRFQIHPMHLASHALQQLLHDWTAGAWRQRH